MLAERERALTAGGEGAVDVVDSAFDNRSSNEFSRVQCRGRFLHNRELLLGPRSKDGKHGFYLVTPFVTNFG